MPLTLCPDTIAGHHGCLVEINCQISALKTRQAQIEHSINEECIPSINAHEHVLRDIGGELFRIIVESSDPFRDFIQNRVSWNLGSETIQLRAKVESLCEQKRQLEAEWHDAADRLTQLRNQRSVHVELIGTLVCDNPACIAFLTQQP
jgi:hypothetical protein